jgi:myo-inositol-1-phosphate synthase
MKSPHNQRPDSQAREDTEAFIAKYARQRGVPSGKEKKAKKGKKAKANAK